MKIDQSQIRNSAVIFAEEQTAAPTQPQPSPELAGFLEIIGHALAQAWLEHNTNMSSHSRADTNFVGDYN